MGNRVLISTCWLINDLVGTFGSMCVHTAGHIDAPQQKKKKKNYFIELTNWGQMGMVCHWSSLSLRHAFITRSHVTAVYNYDFLTMISQENFCISFSLLFSYLICPALLCLSATYQAFEAFPMKPSFQQSTIRIGVSGRSWYFCLLTLCQHYAGC